MTHENIIIILKTLTLVLGGLITYYSFKAYQRTKAKALRALTLGFGIVTIGTLLAGVIDQLAGFPRMDAILVESILIVLGFAIILYSLYAE